MRKIIITVVFLFFATVVSAQQVLRLGINFPMRSPEKSDIFTYMDLVNESGAQMARQLTFGDVLWKQVEPADDQWDFARPDSVFLNYTGIEYVGNLYDFSLEEGSCGFQVPWKAGTNRSTIDYRWTASRDSNDTKDYLDTVIRRYQSSIKYWELGNEVENGGYPNGLPIGPFVTFLKYNYRWIKTSDPESKIVLPSYIGTFGVPVQGKYDWLRAVFALGGGDYIDIIGYHDYNSWWTIPSHIDSIMAIRAQYGLESKPVWLTESSISSNPNTMSNITPEYSSVDEQAADVWRRSCLAWGKGVELFIWHCLWSSAPPSEWQEFGLADNNGKKKKSFHSYKMLAEKLVNFSSVSLESAGLSTNDNTSGGDGIWDVRFIVDGKPVHVMWSPDNRSYTLTGIGNGQIKLTKVVPDYISPDGETVTFDSGTYTVTDGSLTVDLTGIPVIVEEIDGIFVENSGLPGIFMLGQNYPNPFNPETSISFSLPLSRKVTVKVFDILGREIATIAEKEYPAGSHTVTFRGNSLASGVYFYKIVAGNYSETKKMMIVR